MRSRFGRALAAFALTSRHARAGFHLSVHSSPRLRSRGRWRTRGFRLRGEGRIRESRAHGLAHLRHRIDDGDPGGTGHLHGAVCWAFRFLSLHAGALQVAPIFGEFSKHWALGLGLTIIVVVALLRGASRAVGLNPPAGRALSRVGAASSPWTACRSISCARSACPVSAPTARARRRW